MSSSTPTPPNANTQTRRAEILAVLEQDQNAVKTILQCLTYSQVAQLCLNLNLNYARMQPTAKSWAASTSDFVDDSKAVSDWDKFLEALVTQHLNVVEQELQKANLIPPAPPQATTATSQKPTPNSSSDYSGCIIGAAFIGIVIGLVLGFVFHSQTFFLQSISSYDFENNLPDTLMAIGNQATVSLSAPGFNSKKALKIDVPPKAQGNQIGTRLTVSPPMAGQAVSAVVFLPENQAGLNGPVYAQLIARSANGKDLDSSQTPLQPGYWSPLFLGVRSSSWSDLNIKEVDLLVLCPNNRPCTGSVYIDNLTVYKLQDQQAGQLPTPAP